MGAGSPLVSVVTPLCNSARFIQETLAHLLSQSCTTWECILVDDGSTDDTHAAVAPFLADRRFVYFRQQHSGIAAARNAAIARARGEWICLLDHDDRWLPEKLERQLAAAHDGSGGILFTDAFIVTDAWRRLYSEIVGREMVTSFDAGADTGWEETVSLFLAHNPICTSSAMVPAALFDRLGPFDPSAVPAEDYDFWLRAIGAGERILFVDEPLVEYKLHDANYSGDRARLLRSVLYVLEKHRATFPNHGLELERALALRRRQYLTIVLQAREWTRAAREVLAVARRAFNRI